MTRQAEREAGIAYPRLDKDQIDLIIGSLLATIRDRDLGGRIDNAEMTAGYLASFYTRRWGLPPSIRARAGGVG